MVVGTHRYDLDRLPREVIREAVANAVAHRVYEDSRRPVRVEVRPAEVRVVSPGPLPEPVTPESMREQTAPRNISVIASLRRYGLAEDEGRGVDLIEDSMTATMLDPPRFIDDGASVTVVLPLTTTVTPRERAWGLATQRSGRIRPADRLLLVHAAPVGLPLTDAERRDLILSLAASGSVTNETVCGATGLDRVQALTLLRQLVERGDLEVSGQKRGTRYSLAPKALPPSHSDSADRERAMVEDARQVDGS